jgi:hypothetical protein
MVSSTYGGGGLTGAGFWVEAVQMGTIVGMLLVLVQLSLASLVLTCGPGRFFHRLVAYWLVVGWISGCVLASAVLGRWLSQWLERFSSPSGAFVHDSYSNMMDYDGMRAAAALPVLMLGFQTPLWLGRIVFGWRLQRASGDSPGSTESAPQKSLSIRDLMIGTAIIALSLGLLQFADRLTVSTEQGSERGYLFGVLGFSIFLVVAEVIGAIPLAVLILRRQSLLFAWIATAAYALACPLILILLELTSGAAGNLGLLLFVNCAGVLPPLALYAVGLSLLRRYGWRLECRSARSSQSS